MQVKGIRYFVTVADELNFGKAAGRLQLTQSGLSQGIKAVEHQLGVTLFERDRRHVALTSAGQALLPVARRLLDHADDLGRIAAGLTETAQGVLVIGQTHSTGVGLPFILTSAFRGVEPEAKLRVLSGFSSLNVARVAKGTVDLGFVRPPLHADGNVTSMVIGHDAVVLAVPFDHPLAEAESVTTGDVRDEQLVFFNRESGGLWKSMMDAVYGPDYRPPIARVEPDSVHILGAVAEGAGVSLLTESAADILNVAGVVIKRFAEPVKVPMGMAWRNDNVNPVLSRFLGFTRSFLGPAVVDTEPSCEAS